MLKSKFKRVAFAVKLEWQIAGTFPLDPGDCTFRGGFCTFPSDLSAGAQVTKTEPLQPFLAVQRAEASWYFGGSPQEVQSSF